QDVLLLKVEQDAKGVCHTGRASCFYRAVTLREPAGHMLVLTPRDAEKVFDPAQVYGTDEKAG
ncbi:MAG: phosphoribosyl-AMP cyclohydrolase, partial [Rhodoplanes sp.]